MPRGLTKDQKAYARSVFIELIDVRGLSQAELASQLGRDPTIGSCDQTTVSRAKNSGAVSMQILLGAARLAGRPSSEVKKITGFDADPVLKTPTQGDPKFGTFLLRLGEVPGLRGWLNEHPEGATIGEVWAGIQAYEKTPTLSRSNDGQPTRGWEGFFADLRAGRIGVPSTQGGDAAAVLQLERSERPNLPSTTLPPKPVAKATRKPEPRKPRERET